MDYLCFFVMKSGQLLAFLLNGSARKSFSSVLDSNLSEFTSLCFMVLNSAIREFFPFCRS